MHFRLLYVEKERERETDRRRENMLVKISSKVFCMDGRSSESSPLVTVGVYIDVQLTTRRAHIHVRVDPPSQRHLISWLIMSYRTGVPV